MSTADFNGDGWIDIYVANDGTAEPALDQPAQRHVQGHGAPAGAALSGDGKAEASMGVDAGDFDNDGDEDLFITELTGEGNDALRQRRQRACSRTRARRRASARRACAYTGFGTAWFDFDNDGWLDILTVNGSVSGIEAQARAKDPFPLHQREAAVPQPRQRPVRGRVGRRPARCSSCRRSSRGAAFGDVDNDGDTDVLVGNDNGPLRLLINNVGNRNHWLGLRLVGAGGTRDMLGARVADRPRRTARRCWRRARSDGSYASANDPRVLVGLGSRHASGGPCRLAGRPRGGVHGNRHRPLADSTEGGGK